LISETWLEMAPICHNHFCISMKGRLWRRA